MRNEATMSEPWAVDDAPADFIARMLRAIVGIELEVTRVEAKRKLSQNRSAEDVAGVVAGLAGGDDRTAAVAQRWPTSPASTRPEPGREFAHLAPGGGARCANAGVGSGVECWRQAPKGRGAAGISRRAERCMRGRWRPVCRRS